MASYFESGFTVREPAWHKMGEVLDDYPDNWNGARKHAGLTWEPIIVPAYVKMPEPVLVPQTKCGECGAHAGMVNERKEFECAVCGSFTIGIMSEFMPIENFNAVARNDTYAGLGVVSDQFSLVTHEQMGQIMEALHESDSALKFASAGSVKKGAHVWSLAYLDEPVTIARDDTASYPYLALTNAHDGSGACRVFFTTVRIVCWNTYSAAIAEAERNRTQYIFRHTGNMAEKIEEAKRAIHGMREDHNKWVELAEELYRIPVRKEELDRYVFLFLPEPPAEVISPRVRENIDTARSTFRTLYESSPTTDGHRGTALGLLDASVEYLDHLRGFRNRDTYLGRTMLRHEPMKSRAHTLIRELVESSN